MSELNSREDTEDERGRYRESETDDLPLMPLRAGPSRHIAPSTSTATTTAATAASRSKSWPDCNEPARGRKCLRAYRSMPATTDYDVEAAAEDASGAGGSSADEEDECLARSISTFMEFDVDMEFQDLVRKIRQTCGFNMTHMTLARRLLEEGSSITHIMDGPNSLAHFLNRVLLYVKSDKGRVPSKKVLWDRKKTPAELLEEIFAAVENSNHSNKNKILNFRLEGYSLLAMAIRCSDLMIVKTLVAAGADINHITDENETALHLAVANPDILEFFLDLPDISIQPDKKGRLPIYNAAEIHSEKSIMLLLKKFGTDQLTKKAENGWTIWHFIALNNSIKTAQYLIHSKNFGSCPSINDVNENGDTPLYEATYGGHATMAEILLRSGATLSSKGSNKTAIELIAKNFTDPLNFFEDLFDAFVFKTDILENQRMHVNYTFLTHSKDESQIKVVEELLRCGLNKLLKHPVIESLIYLKWKCLQPVFLFSMFLYAMFLVAFNTFVIRTFSVIDANKVKNVTLSATEEPLVASCGLSDWLLIAFIYTFIAALFIQECIWMHLRGLLGYFFRVKSSMKSDLDMTRSKIQHLKWGTKRCLELRVEPFVRLSGLVLAAAVPALVGCAGAGELAPEPWQRHVACAALLLAWLQALLVLSRCPGNGYYVIMFERVAVNIFKIFVTAIGLVVAFSIIFMIQYQSAKPFNGPGTAFVKTLVMMTSEFDYEGLFDETHTEIDNRRAVVYLLFVLFVFFIAIVLMNFMIGIAVSDINELTAIGNIRRLEKQVELLSAWQVLGNTMLGKWSKKLSHIRFHGEIIHQEKSDTASRKWEVRSLKTKEDFELINVLHFEPSYLEFFDKELHDAIYSIARKKKQYEFESLINEVVQQERDDSDSPIIPMKDRMKVIEAIVKEIKESVDDLKESNDRRTSIEEGINEIRQFMRDLKKKM